MTNGAIAAVIMILAATAFATWTNRHRKVVMAMVAPLYGLAIVAGILYFTHEQVQQKARDHKDCVTSVSRSDGNRTQHLAIAARLEERGLPADAQFLRDQLDVNLPQRTVEDCP